MIDKFDVFYGITNQTREKVMYWIFTCIVSIAVLYNYKETKHFVHLSFPSSIMESFLFMLSLLLLGLITYFLVLIIYMYLDIKHFRKQDKQYFINQTVLNVGQKERILKKIHLRRELYSIILKPNEHNDKKLTDKQWRFYVKKVGTRNEILSKMKFLHYIEMKIKEIQPLKNPEIEYLNDMMFEKRDIYLFKRLQKDLKQ